ncbi:MAG: hypothetical protein KM312_06635 [Hydrogenibacillus schlegelii]|uniref:Uncharacterized protein n=1 Tax=Hydrogenibacillus schlegelii TaxID=1484 RepID=A0A947CWC8_HYDSH|nr:hypothetical protein [Hydrogenibacillus schlegelii]
MGCRRPEANAPRPVPRGEGKAARAFAPRLVRRRGAASGPEGDDPLYEGAAILAEGQSFHRRYRALLRDTGRLPVERLARAHLGADLTRPKFWERAVEAAVADVETFVREADVLPADGER